MKFGSIGSLLLLPSLGLMSADIPPPLVRRATSKDSGADPFRIPFGSLLLSTLGLVQSGSPSCRELPLPTNPHHSVFCCCARSMKRLLLLALSVAVLESATACCSRSRTSERSKKHDMLVFLEHGGTSKVVLATFSLTRPKKGRTSLMLVQYMLTEGLGRQAEFGMSVSPGSGTKSSAREIFAPMRMVIFSVPPLQRLKFFMFSTTRIEILCGVFRR
jgi:hypothetical protein